MCTQLDDANCGYLKCCCLLRPHGVSRGLPVQQLLTSDQIQSKYLNQTLIGWKSRSEFCAVNLFFLWENTSASLAVDKICVYCFFYQKVFLTSIFKNTWLFLDHAYWSEMDHCTVSRWVMIFESLTCFMFGHLFSECYLQNIKCWSLCFQLLRLNPAMNTVRL